MNVAEYITEFFIRKEIRHIFGFQGGAILKILDSMISSGKIEYIQNYHEQASSFCADAYARVTQDVGVAIATSGPGATNLINGITNAYMDSIPCIFITGQYHSTKLQTAEDVRSNGFQDLDIVSIVKPITKYAVTIFDPNKIKYELEKCYYIAKSGRPGSVVLDIPIDIQFMEIDETKLIDFFPEKSSINEPSKINDFIELLKSAKRPLVLIGGGVRIAGAQDQLRNFVKLAKIPAVATLNGIDVYDESFGFAGLYGNTHCNLAIYNADLLIVLGSRLGQHQVGKTKEGYTKAKVVHVDIDKSELDRAFKEDLSINCEVRIFLEQLNQELKNITLPQYSSWIQTIQKWQVQYQNNTHLENEFLDPVKFVKDINEYFADDAIMVSDVGQNQMWIAQAIKTKAKQRLLNSSGFGSMGYSLPAAIGAKTAKPNCQVISFAGDAGFQMNIQELLLVSQKKLNIKCFVFNNNTLGMTKDIQRIYYKENYYGATSDYYSCVDLELLSKAYGFEYFKITANEQEKEIKNILAQEKPYIIELKLNSDSKLLTKFQEAEIFKKEELHD